VATGFDIELARLLAERAGFGIHGHSELN
jgi:hypothetical protein